MPDLFRAHVNIAGESLSVEINRRIERAAPAELPRSYLGASAVGHECARQTQLAWWRKPLLSARVRAIFARGHFFEAHTRARLVASGFVFAPEEACAFVALEGDLQGHADGIIIAAPPLPGAYLAIPCIWEHKALNAKNYRAVTKDGLGKVFPKYVAQIQLYQKFLGKLNAALVSIVNSDTCELCHFTLPHNPTLADDWTERAKTIIAATRKGELLPRAFDDPDDWRCKMCEHRAKCWGLADGA